MPAGRTRCGNCTSAKRHLPQHGLDALTCRSSLLLGEICESQALTPSPPSLTSRLPSCALPGLFTKLAQPLSTIFGLCLG